MPLVFAVTESCSGRSMIQSVVLWLGRFANAFLVVDMFHQLIPTALKIDYQESAYHLWNPDSVSGMVQSPGRFSAPLKDF